MIKACFKNSTIYYLLSGLVVFLGVVLAFWSRDNKELQAISIVISAIFYVGFGLLHQYYNHDLHVKIVIEYVLIAALGVSIVLFLLKTGFL